MIFSPDEQNEKIKNLLKTSRQDFRFDQTGIKTRLIPSLDQTEILPAYRRFLNGKVLAYSMSGAVLVVFVSSTFAFAASSQPGDKLFALNKWKEKMILQLPLSMNQKASFETGIVNNRLKALENVSATANQAVDDKALATVKESDESLHDAVELVANNKHQFEAQGLPDRAKQMDATLTELDNLAMQHQQQIEVIEADTTDDANREFIKQHLHQIYNTRVKAHQELHIDMELEQDDGN